MEKFLHIIAFDIPYPPNYGGAIDVFFRVKTLSEKGVQVILHCFEYNRERSVILDNMCYKVYYYKRKTNLLNNLSFLPYTVYSRKNATLLSNLKKDNYPILFEGLMSCYYMNDKTLAHRQKIYREANVEHDYYLELFNATNFSFSKIYYLIESFKFRIFEKNLQHAQIILAISKVDKDYYQLLFPNSKVEFIPCFHSNKSISTDNENGEYILYHGNLSVPENTKTVIYLIENVFSKLPFRCVIAGMNPSRDLVNKCKTQSNVEIIANPNHDDLKEIIQKAQVHILLTFQSTGLKIKLLNTLFAGKHIVVNDKMLVGSGLEQLCHIGNTPHEQIELCTKLMYEPFQSSEIDKRTQILIPEFSNEFLASKIISIINKRQNQ